MELDIRGNKNSVVDSIRFANNNDEVGSVIMARTTGLSAGVKILDGSGRITNVINTKDVDNFILALKEAKERWE
jgi:hypothetical protein